MDKRLSRPSLGLFLSAAVCAVVLVTTIAISLAGYVSASSAVQQQAHQRLAGVSREAQAAIDAYLAARLDELGTMVERNLLPLTVNPQQRAQVLYNYDQAFGEHRYLDLTLIDARGKIMGSTSAPMFDGSASWFNRVLQETQPRVVGFEPFADQTKAPIVLSVPVIDPLGKRVGTLIGRLSMTEISQMLHAVPLEPGTQLELSNGDTVLDTAVATGATPLPASAATVQESTKADDVGLSVASKADAGVAYASVRSLAVESAITGFVIFILAALAAFLIARRIAHPVRNAAIMARSLADGRLDIEADDRHAPVAELKDLSLAFNEMSVRMRSLIRGVESTSLTISRNVAGSLETVRAVDAGAAAQEASVTRIAGSLLRLSGDAQNNARDCSMLEQQSRLGLMQLDQLVHELDGTTETLTSLSAFVEESNAAGRQLTQQANEVAVRARRASEKATAASALAGTGGEAVRGMVTDLQQVGAQLLVTVERLHRLAKSTGEAINGQLQVVSDVAERSKLLALNAAIEAARAGEAGRGFGIIAGELHKLADHSHRATGEISGLVKDVLKETRTVADDAQEASTIARGAIERANNAGGTFEELIAQIDDSFAAMRDIGGIAEEQARRTHEIQVATQSLDRMTGTSAEALRKVNDLSKEVRSKVHLANEVASSVAGATKHQISAFSQMEGTIEEIRLSANGVAAVAASSLQSTEKLRGEVDGLTAQLAGFSMKNGGDEPPLLPPSRLPLPPIGRMLRLIRANGPRVETPA